MYHTIFMVHISCTIQIWFCRSPAQYIFIFRISCTCDTLCADLITDTNLIAQISWPRQILFCISHAQHKYDFAYLRRTQNLSCVAHAPCKLHCAFLVTHLNTHREIVPLSLRHPAGNRMWNGYSSTANDAHGPLLRLPPGDPQPPFFFTKMY